MTTWDILVGDVRERLRDLPDASAQTVVTSPPYWGLRDYGADGQLGLEPTPEAYVANLVEVFREVRRVLRDDGTVWLNLGDSYASGTGRNDTDEKNIRRRIERFNSGNGPGQGPRYFRPMRHPLKPKDLVGIPWRVAFALQADGWYLRSDIIWAKPNPMPESVTDRPTKAHEYVFLLSKSARYFYDADAVREPHAPATLARIQQATFDSQNGGPKDYGEGSNRSARRALVNLRGRVMAPQIEDGHYPEDGRNIRSVWNIATHPFPGAHFATFPPKLVEPCIKAGSAEGDTVLDPFAGSGTTGMVALRLGRSFVGIELNPTYAEMARNRIRDDAPLFNVGAEVIRQLREATE